MKNDIHQTKANFGVIYFDALENGDDESAQTAWEETYTKIETLKAKIAHKEAEIKAINEGKVKFYIIKKNNINNEMTLKNN